MDPRGAGIVRFPGMPDVQRRYDAGHQAFAEAGQQAQERPQA